MVPDRGVELFAHLISGIAPVCVQSVPPLCTTLSTALWTSRTPNQTLSAARRFGTELTLDAAKPCERLSQGAGTSGESRPAQATRGRAPTRGLFRLAYYPLGEPTQRPWQAQPPDINSVTTMSMRTTLSGASREPMRMPRECKCACDEWVKDEYQQGPAPINRRQQCHAHHEGSGDGLGDEYAPALSTNHVNAFISRGGRPTQARPEEGGTTSGQRRGRFLGLSEPTPRSLRDSLSHDQVCSTNVNRLIRETHMSDF